MTVRHALSSGLALAIAVGFFVAEPAGAQAAGSPDQVPTVFTFCYMPKTGAVYRIKTPDTRDSCINRRHVEFSWTDAVPDHDHGALNGLSDDDHPEYVREGEAAGGDMAGTYPDPSVVGLQGSPISGTAPEAGEVLGWDGSAWTPTAVANAVTEVNAGDGLRRMDGLDGVVELAHDLTSTQPSVANGGTTVVQSLGFDDFGHTTSATSADLGALFIARGDPAIQRRVTGSCAPGSSIRAIAPDGAVTCEPDDAGAATLTSPDGRFSISVTNDGVRIVGPGGSLDLDASTLEVATPLGASLTLASHSATLFAPLKLELHSAAFTDLKGVPITLNGDCHPAARKGDGTLLTFPPAGIITSGSPLVRLC